MGFYGNVFQTNSPKKLLVPQDKDYCVYWKNFFRYENKRNERMKI